MDTFTRQSQVIFWDYIIFTGVLRGTVAPPVNLYLTCSPYVTLTCVLVMGINIFNSIWIELRFFIRSFRGSTAYGAQILGLKDFDVVWCLHSYIFEVFEDFPLQRRFWIQLYPKGQCGLIIYYPFFLWKCKKTIGRSSAKANSGDFASALVAYNTAPIYNPRCRVAYTTYFGSTL